LSHSNAKQKKACSLNYTSLARSEMVEIGLMPANHRSNKLSKLNFHFLFYSQLTLVNSSFKHVFHKMAYPQTTMDL
jgi:hypothetical protein